jgi:hypothetical protein
VAKTQTLHTDGQMTVSELAEFITASSDPAEIARVTRRLRHLTTVGALDTAGEVHTGAGRHRLYGTDSTAAAAILVTLGDMGMSVGILKQAATAIRMTMAIPDLPGMSRTPKYWEAAVNGEPMLFGIAIGAGADRDSGEPGVRAVFLVPPAEFNAERTRFSDASGLILLDLQRIFGHAAT